jgi:hypothetical protein
MVMYPAGDLNGIVSANSLYPYFVTVFVRTADPPIVVLTVFVSVLFGKVTVNCPYRGGHFGGKYLLKPPLTA